MSMFTTLEPGDWSVICADGFGVTIDGKSRDGEALADRFAAAAQQEFDQWPTIPPAIYMLVEPENAEHALLAERETVRQRQTEKP